MSPLEALAASGGGGAVAYVDDVFSTYLYTGNGRNAVNSGIPLASSSATVIDVTLNGENSYVWCVSDASGATYYVSNYSANSTTQVTKVNATGTVVYNNRYNISHNWGSTGCQPFADANGVLYVPGVAYGFAKISADGTTCSAFNSYINTSNGPFYAQAICADASGNIYVAGYSMGGFSAYMLTVVKYNASMVPQWTQVIDGMGGNVYPTGINFNAVSGFLYVSGAVENPAGGLSYEVISRINPSSGARSGGVIFNDQTTAYLNYSFRHTLDFDASGNVHYCRAKRYVVLTSALSATPISSYALNASNGGADFSGVWVYGSDVFLASDNSGYVKLTSGSPVAVNLNGACLGRTVTSTSVCLASGKNILIVPNDGSAPCFNAAGNIANLQNGAFTIASSSYSISALSTSGSGSVTSNTVYNPSVTAVGSSTVTTAPVTARGGLVWTKPRGGTGSHVFVDTVRGAQYRLASDSASQQINDNQGLLSFTTTGHVESPAMSSSGQTYVSWTFRKANKFFDVVTYTGDGVSGRTISHNLGSVPGCIIVKRTNGGLNSWAVYHRSLGATQYLYLESTNAASTGSNYWFNTSPTASNFTVGGSSDVNLSGASYVAYLFAHDTATDGLIQCGNFTTTGTSTTQVALGWEPQWILFKRTDAPSNWQIDDILRGLTVDSANSSNLWANTTASESIGIGLGINSTGFFDGGNLAAGNYVYIAIRRPNKPPSSGASVFVPVTYTSTGAAQNITTGFAPDFAFNLQRSNTGASTGYPVVASRLQGDADIYLATTNAEYTLRGIQWNQSSWGVPSGGSEMGGNGTPFVLETFKRAPGFFDVVCYKGDGNLTYAVPHNLTVAPDFAIIKCRNYATTNWIAAYRDGSSLGLMRLNTTDAATTGLPSSYLNASNFVTGGSALGGNETTITSNYSLGLYATYLFASLTGVSKFGTYTGNGTSQTINCGFSAGARFILIKRTDAAGDWYVWDTARGIVAANDPHLSLNTTAAEVTTDDTIDPATSGFIVNQVAATNVNVTGATYMYFAIA